MPRRAVSSFERHVSNVGRATRGASCDTLRKRPFAPHFSVGPVATLLCGLCVLLADRSTLSGAEPATTPVRVLDLAPSPTGTASCLAVACHGGLGKTSAAGQRDSVSSRAGRIWLHEDPHARAAATLDSPRYRQIVERLATHAEPDAGVADSRSTATRASIARRCAACHDPVGLTRDVRPDDPRRSPDASANHSTEHGIDCATCHGQADRWLEKHFERNVTPAELTSLGMRDLRHAYTRAESCVACHVGDSRHDLNHDMLAAGHPPLRFEFSSYHVRLPKHWRGPADAAEYRRETLALWSAGQLAAASASLELTGVRARAARQLGRDVERARQGEVEDGDGRATALAASAWPELAEFDCLACHQRLRPAPAAASRPGDSAGFLVRTAAAPPNRSVWHTRVAIPWAVRLAERLDLEPEAPAGGADGTGTELESRWRELVANLEHRPPQSLDEIAQSSEALSADLRRLGRRSPRLGQRDINAAIPLSAVFDDHATLASLLDVADEISRTPLDWESACQLTLALEAARRASRPVATAPAEQIALHDEIVGELRRIRMSLAFGARQVGGRRQEVEWPRTLEPRAPDEPDGSDERRETLDPESLVRALRRAVRLLSQQEGLE